MIIDKWLNFLLVDQSYCDIIKKSRRVTEKGNNFFFLLIIVWWKVVIKEQWYLVTNLDHHCNPIFT